MKHDTILVLLRSLLKTPSHRAWGLFRPWQHPALGHWDSTSHSSTQPQGIGTPQAAPGLGASPSHRVERVLHHILRELWLHWGLRWCRNGLLALGIEQFKAEREPHETSSCANAPWRGCRPEECVLPPRLTSPPSPPSLAQSTSYTRCEKIRAHLMHAVGFRSSMWVGCSVVDCCPYLLLINLASWMP